MIHGGASFGNAHPHQRQSTSNHSGSNSSSNANHLLELSGVSSKIPPAWGPELEAHLPFVNYVQDVTSWSMGTDVDADKQAHRMVLRLSGVAKA